MSVSGSRWQQVEVLFGEDLVDETHVLVVGDLSSGDVDGDAGALLASVLQGEETVVDLSCEGSLDGGGDSEDAALLVHAEFLLRDQNFVHITP